MKKSILAAVLLLLFALPAVARTVDGIAAVVNDEIITTHQLDKELQNAGQLPADQRDRLRKEVLGRLIDDALIRQRIKELGLKVGDEELEAAIQDVQKQNKLTRPQLEEAVKAQGMGFDEYKENLRQQILRFKLMGRDVQSKVEVTNEEIRDYFRQNIDKYREEPTVRLNRLTFPLPEKATAELQSAVLRRASEALKHLRKGEPFDSVLQAFAEKGAEGGDMGSFEAGQLTPSFAAAVRDLKVGEVSEPVPTPRGVHLLQVVERNPGRVRQFDSVKEEISRILKERKTESRMKEWSEGLKKKAYIDVRI